MQVTRVTVYRNNGRSDYRVSWVHHSESRKCCECNKEVTSYLLFSPVELGVPFGIGAYRHVCPDCVSLNYPELWDIL